MGAFRRLLAASGWQPGPHPRMRDAIHSACSLFTGLHLLTIFVSPCSHQFYPQALYDLQVPFLHFFGFCFLGWRHCRQRAYCNRTHEAFIGKRSSLRANGSPAVQAITTGSWVRAWFPRVYNSGRLRCGVWIGFRWAPEESTVCRGSSSRSLRLNVMSAYVLVLVDYWW